MIAGINSFRPVDELLGSRSLLPQEIGVRIGCVGCSSEVCGSYLIDAPRESREAMADDLRAASDLTGIPVTVTGPKAFTTETADAVANCSVEGAEKPCEDKALIALFELPRIR